MTSRTMLWTLIVVVGGVLLVVISRAGVTAPLENAVLFVVSPAQRALGDAASPVDEFFDNIGEADNLREENERLRTENEQLASEVASLRESETRLEELRQLLQLKETQPEEEFLAANILAHEPSNLKEMVAIDRGEQDGVQEGMAQPFNLYPTGDANLKSPTLMSEPAGLNTERGKVKIDKVLTL